MAERLQELDYAALQQCMHCGMCLPTCPTYDATGRERHSPRGRIALMRAVADGELAISQTFAEEMSYCVGCLACQTACPAGVDYGELLGTARAQIEGTPLARPRERAFWRAISLRGLFLSPRLLRAAGVVLRGYQASGLAALARRLRLTRLLPSALARLEADTPIVGPAFSNALIRATERPAGAAPRYRVALLTGCVQDLIFASVNRDTADVLLMNGCEVDTPPRQPCCGALHAHNGELAAARTLARRMIDLIPPERYDAIITNAGGCGAHLRHYARLLGEDPRHAARARVWDAKVRDIHEWLVDIDARMPAVGPFDRPTRVTYHDACHLAHGQRVVDQPRALLARLPGVSCVPLTEASWCCGSAGVYSITQPEQSAALLARKIAHVLATGASVLVTANPGCHLQIARGLQAQAVPMDVRHPVTLLASAYRRESSRAARPQP